jgi:nicotinamidase-related amidase
MYAPKTQALLVLDYQEGVGDQPYAKAAAVKTAVAITAARNAGLRVIFSKVELRPGYPDVSPRNRVFEAMKVKNMLPPGTGKLISAFVPSADEIVVEKRRFGAFSGNDLEIILRSNTITSLVLAGVSTSGVILSTFCKAADEDYEITILSDACADPQPSLHLELMTNLFPRSAEVVDVDGWSKTLAR